MLFSTYWKCLLTDGDMCWQTLPHFVQREGREKGWGGKQRLISNGTKDIEIERKIREELIKISLQYLRVQALQLKII